CFGCCRTRRSVARRCSRARRWASRAAGSSCRCRDRRTRAASRSKSCCCRSSGTSSGSYHGDSEGGFAPLPTVVTRLTAHSSLPPPATRIAPAKPALERSLHDASHILRRLACKEALDAQAHEYWSCRSLLWALDSRELRV